MSHDDTWRFIVLGRSLERVDLTVRLLSTRLGDAWGSAGWVATLRCCAAYESYLRTYRRGVEGSKALEFLLLDRLFPRSVFHTLGAAETVLFDLDPTSDRHGTGSEPRRVVGRACADLEFIRVAELERFAARASRPARTSGRTRARRHRQAVLQRCARHPVERVMAWRLSIEHVTSYEYEGEVLASYNEARMSPARDSTQMVLDHRVDVRPGVPVMRYIDYWGTEVSAFDVHEPHDRLIVAARSLVETVAAIPDVTDTDWEVLSDENVRDRFCEYLHSSPHVPIDESFRRGRGRDRRGRSPRETVEAVSSWVRESLAYEPGATDVSTNARSALELGSGRLPGLRPCRAGVVAGFGHPGSLRLRLPASRRRRCRRCRGDRSEPRLARSVDGVLAAPRSDQRRTPSPKSTSSSHAGRDYGDVTPLKGVYNGPPSRSSDVRVTIRRVA